ncbi:MAG: general stress protein CsbD [Nitrococcus sp.]|nr:general stress protein CsbD [Nitrococcus sp.]
MSWDNVKADWNQNVGQVRIYWDKLTEDELHEVKGDRNRLIEMIHRKYAIPKDDADEQVKVFESRFEEPHFKQEHPYYEQSTGENTPEGGRG